VLHKPFCPAKLRFKMACLQNIQLGMKFPRKAFIQAVRKACAHRRHANFATNPRYFFADESGHNLRRKIKPYMVVVFSNLQDELVRSASKLLTCKYKTE